MKRMSKVFDLPLSHSHEFIYEAGKEFDYCMASFDEYDQAEAACNAINHVDALADALAGLLDAVVNRSSHDSINNQIIAAAKALGKYRGEK